MQRLLTGLVVAAITVLVPVLAMAANQEVAEQIAANLRKSGQLQDYKIGVKYQDGTAWLRGRVSSQEQVNAVLKVVFQTSGVTRVVNNMTAGSGMTNVPATKPNGPARTAMLGQPLRQLDTISTPEQFRPASSSLRTTQSKHGGCQTHATRRLDQVLSRAAKQLLRPTQSAERVPASFASASAEPVSAITVRDEPKATLQQKPTLAPRPATAVRQVRQQAPSQAIAPRQVPRQVQQRTPSRSIMGRRRQPVPVAFAQAGPRVANQAVSGRPVPAYVAQAGGGPQVRYDQPNLPNYAWPGYAAYPNYAALTYPKQYSPTAWPYIGPFYPYPQVPLGWRKVTLEWDDGWWMLDFKD